MIKQQAGITLQQVEAALALPDFDTLTAQQRMFPGGRGQREVEARALNTGRGGGAKAREAGVLALLYDDPADNDGLRVVLTRRAETLRGHRGQISFPGGRRDPEDVSFAACALRETCEELGLCDLDIRILGQLSHIYIPPSNFDVYPYVGYTARVPQFRPNPAEVAEVFSFPLRDLLDTRSIGHEEHDFKGVRVRVPHYRVGQHRVWGATAIMLSEFEGRLRAVLGLPGDDAP